MQRPLSENDEEEWVICCWRKPHTLLSRTKTQQGGTTRFAAACKLGDEHTRVPEKELTSGYRLVWPAAPGWRVSEIREHNLINYSHQEDNKPDVVIRQTQKDAQEQMKSQLGDCVSVSWLSVCLAFAGLIPFCSTSFSLHICQGFSLRAAQVSWMLSAWFARRLIFANALQNRKIKGAADQS